MKVWDIRGNKPEFIMERQMNLGLIQVGWSILIIFFFYLVYCILYPVSCITILSCILYPLFCIVLYLFCQSNQI